MGQFSFPSGHATRAVLLSASCCLLSGLPGLLVVPATAWAAAVCVSRVLLGRHHLLDVAAGAGLGLAEAAVLGALWRSPEQTQYILGLFSEEDPWSSA